jgi:signal transduction histidine kinase
VRSRIVVSVFALTVVATAFTAVIGADGIGVRDAFEVLVVPSSFLLAAAAGTWLEADRSVTRLLAAVGTLHLAAMVISSFVLVAASPHTSAMGAVNVGSQVAYGLGFAGLVALAASYPRGEEGVPRPLPRLAAWSAVVLPVAGGLSGSSPTVMQGNGDLVTAGPIAHILPEQLASLGAAVLLLPVVATVVFIRRYRRAAADVRRRMRWPMLGVGLIAGLALSAVLLDSSLPDAADAVFLLGAPLLPLSIVVGSTVRPPFDIDRLLRRTAVFAGTWMVAATAYGIGIAAAAWAAGGRGLAAAAVLGGILSLTMATPVRRALIGLADERRKLQDDLAAQVELLTMGAAELDESRRRLAAATEIERLRIERDLHDGVQQELIAVIAHIEAARTGLRAAEVAAAPARALEQASALARGAYETVRSVSHGIRPPVLEDLGLVDAIASKAAQSPVPVHVLADDGLADMRWPAEIEGAAYFFAQEGIANVLKHAEATQAFAHISYDDGSLVVEVRDNGRGGLDPAGGTGLAGLSDRFEAFGGSISMVESEGWTRVRALLPAQVVPA